MSNDDKVSFWILTIFFGGVVLWMLYHYYGKDSYSQEEYLQKIEQEYSEYMSSYPELYSYIKEFNVPDINYSEKGNYIRPKLIVLWTGKDTCKLYKSLFEKLPAQYTTYNLNQVETIVLLKTHSKTVGHYSNGGNAIQYFTDISYYSKDKNIIYHRHEIPGSSPPRSISTKSSSNASNQGGYGNPVSNEEIINYITNSLSKN